MVRKGAASQVILRGGVVASAEDWALFFHLLGAFLFVGGAIVAGVAFEAARRRRRPAEIALVLGLTRVGVALVAAGGSIVLLFGLWLVHLGRFRYGAGWVDAALALFVLVVVLGAIGGQRPKRARLLAAELAARDEHESEELRSLLDDRLARTLNYATVVLLLAIVALMVFKPGR
jgi:uncharacterized membrane protein